MAVSTFRCGIYQAEMDQNNDERLRAAESRKSSISYIIDHSNIIKVLLDPGLVTSTEIMEVLLEMEPNERRMAFFGILYSRKSDSDLEVIERQLDADMERTCQYFQSEHIPSSNGSLSLAKYKKYGACSILGNTRFESSLLNNQQFQNDLLSFDLYQLLPASAQTVEKINLRYREHLELTSQLAEARQWIQHHYSVWYRELYKILPSTDISRDLLLSCLEVWPDDQLQKLTDLAPSSRIKDMEVPVMAYLLGLPLESDYKKEKLHNILVSMMEKPELKQQHIQNIKTQNQRELAQMMDHYNSIMGSQPKISNTEDLHAEEIENYLPFDIARYIDESGIVFQFTRPEFKYLASKGTNPTTKRKLPPAFITKLSHVNKVSEYLGLPESSSLETLLKSAMLKVSPLTEELEPLMLMLRAPAKKSSSLALSDATRASIFRMISVTGLG